MFRTTKRDELYHIDASLGSVRLRGSLGTADKTVAYKLRGRLEYAMSSGPNSPEWSTLKGVLPAGTYRRFTKHVGLKVQAEHTLGTLVSIFRTTSQSRVGMKKLATSTEVRYRRVVETFLDWAGDSPLEDITISLLEQFKEFRLAEILKKKNSRDGSSLDLEVAILHQMFNVAVERGWLPKNPVLPEGTPGANPTHGAQPFTPKEMKLLEESAAPHLFDFTLLRWSGLRGSDAADLKWPEIDFKHFQIVRKSIKTGKESIIPLQIDLHRMLIEERAKTKSIFVSDAGSRRVLYERIVAIGKRAGLARSVTPHCLRDSLAVEMLDRGASVYDVAKTLGDSIATVERHYAPQTAQLVNRVRDIFNKS